MKKNNCDILGGLSFPGLTHSLMSLNVLHYCHQLQLDNLGKSVFVNKLCILQYFGIHFINVFLFISVHLKQFH
jgi:hypothetical protein